MHGKIGHDLEKKLLMVGCQNTEDTAVVCLGGASIYAKKVLSGDIAKLMM